MHLSTLSVFPCGFIVAIIVVIRITENLAIKIRGVLQDHPASGRLPNPRTIRIERRGARRNLFLVNFSFHISCFQMSNPVVVFSRISKNAEVLAIRPRNVSVRFPFPSGKMTNLWDRTARAIVSTANRLCRNLDYLAWFEGLTEHLPALQRPLLVVFPKIRPLEAYLGCSFQERHGCTFLCFRVPSNSQKD